MVKTALLPSTTETAPAGLIVPPALALAWIWRSTMPYLASTNALQLLALACVESYLAADEAPVAPSHSMGAASASA